jgi:hypothetical protein
LYAKFEYHDLKGIMRLCPQKSSPKRFDDEEFEQLCDLDQIEKPGPNNANWLMRWRGKAGGKLVGAELEHHEVFKFEYDREANSRFIHPSDCKFMPISITFSMVYNGEPCLFGGDKCEDLKGKTAFSPSILESQWKELDGNQQEGSPFSHAKIALAEVANLQKTALELTSKIRAVQSSLKGATTSTSEPESRSRSRPKTNRVEVMPPFAWGVRGKWKITDADGLIEEVGCLAKDVIFEMCMSNDPKDTNAQRQLFAHFEFGDRLVGMMRLAPASHSKNEEDPTNICEFENKCVLPVGRWPGLEALCPHVRQTWFMRWRGIEAIGRILDPEGAILRKCSGSDEQQTQCRFDQGLDGKLRLTVEMVHHGVTRTLKAVKISDKEPRRISDPGLLQDWDNYALKRPAESL